MFTIGMAVSTSDNDLLKVVERDYVNVKPVWPVCVWVLTMLQKTKKTQCLFEKFSYFINT